MIVDTFLKRIETIIGIPICKGDDDVDVGQIADVTVTVEEGTPNTAAK